MMYLAGPYTHDDPAVVQARYEAHRRATARLCAAGNVVFSPIVHGHHLLPELPGWRHEEWIAFDYAILRHCSRLYVLQIDGWDVSRGTACEIEFAKQYGIPIEYIGG